MHTTIFPSTFALSSDPSMHSFLQNQQKRKFCMTIEFSYQKKATISSLQVSVLRFMDAYACVAVALAPLASSELISW